MEKDKNMSIDDQIKSILEDLRPFLNMDGGDIEFVRFDSEDGTVYVKMYGACAVCMIQDDTLENGLLLALQEKVPCVKNIINTPI